MSRRLALAHSPRELETYDQTVSLAFFPDGKRAVHVTKCELATLLQIQDSCGEGSWKLAACVAAVSKDGRWIVLGCPGGKLRILEAENQTSTWAIETDDGHARKVSALDVSTDSSAIASGSLDGSIIVWSVTTGQRLAGPLNLGSGASGVSFVQFSYCGRRLAGCTSVGEVYILDILDNHQLAQRVVVRFNSRVTAFSWSNNDQILTGLEESLAIIDLSHGTTSHKSITNFRFLSSNGKFIVSGSLHNGVRFWDANTFTEIGPWLPSCLPLAISPNNYLVTVSHSTRHHGLSIWSLSDILPKYYTINEDGNFVSPSHIRSDSHALGFDDEETNALSKLQLSPNPEVHRKNQLYANPAQKEFAEAIVFEVLRERPPILIDTQTGHLCHEALQFLTLEADPIYKELLSFIREQDQVHFRRAVETFFEYVMFSHKWDDPSKEPRLHDVQGKSIYRDLDPSPTNDKLRRFCELVRETGHRWAWSDTCCIDRSDSHVLSKAITSMYRWYEHSALTLAFLANPSRLDNIRDSVWMTRAWTLQELLAPRVIRFYDSEWKPYRDDPHHNHKDSPFINEQLATAVSVESRMLCAFRPGDLGVRERLRLASTRVATIPEDIAYSLFGIFASDLQPKYGEGINALGRLLEEIVHRSGDVTVLAWTGRSSRFNSCLPAEIAVYNEPSQTVSDGSGANKLRTRAVELQPLWPRDAAVAVYDRIINLPKASFSNRRLRLPCITFAVNGVTAIADSPERRVYRASVPVLGDVLIKTADQLPVREPRRLLLAHPWIRDLLNPLGEIIPALFVPTGKQSLTATCPALLASDADDYTRALWLIARLRQEFRALLFQQQHHQSYKRVAADSEIVVSSARITCLQDVRTEMLDVWDDHPSPL